VHLARLATLCGLLIALAVGRPLGAQTRSAGEVGLSHVHFSEDDVTVVGPSARWWLTYDTPRLLTTASAGGFAGSGGASGNGDLTATWRTAVAPGWRADLGGELSSVLGTGSGSSGSTLVSARLLRSVAYGGLWLNAGGNASRREAGTLWGRALEAGAWWRWPRAQLSASFESAWSAAQLFLGPYRQDVVGIVPVRYTEGNVGLQVERDDASLSLTAAVRRDPDAAHLTEAGVSATAMWWLTDTRAVVISAARQLPDFQRGADAMQALTIGVRLNEPTPAVARVARARPVIQVAGSDSTRTVRVRAAGARRVELMADFTGWEPVELAPSGDVFSREFVLSSGTHRLVVRLDGGPWVPAVNTPAVDDDFGGRVGLLVVP
jgi:hypothetical protein